MKIIFIHGINQQSLDAHSFQSYWLKVFNLGLQKNNLPLDVDDLQLAFPFYGDILTQHNQKNALDINTMLPNWSFFDKLPKLRERNSHNIKKALEIPLLPHYAQDQPYSLKNKFFLLSQLAKDRVLKEMVILLNHFPDFHESLVQKFISEAYLYWYDPTFKQQVHERILSCFEPNEKHIVIAHSLGTVIAYNILQELPEQYQIERFITLASPLPFNVVQRHLEPPMQRPKTLSGDWYNFFAQDDYLTTFPMQAPLFDFQPPVHNQLITTFIDKPHEIMGYLQHPLVIRCILEQLYDFSFHPEFQ
ncbi:hypothetical protein [Acinetobacter sp. MD2(2019)]|uniref:hypothetical protein n=1 Tax=Acinetobacter sp. MD2(2019) TaxID=2605273 RepID=UPI002D1EB68C|nr:hypothetical protein [Acinetobacter sp. MD2(2019)]MEB3753747.1 hypothetical protein [Acinetobacter sp. MD2(2019)]